MQLYLSEKRGMSITDVVLDALSKSGYNNQTAQDVIIQSTNKSVLTRFKEKSKYKRMYKVGEDIRSADITSIQDIKSFAESVAVGKKSVFPEIQAFATGATNIVSKLQKFNLTVYVYTFMNEFTSQAWDFYADPVAEINSFVIGAGIDGIITDFPGTAAAYRRNKCLTMRTLPPCMTPVEPGNLLQMIAPAQLPPAEAPNPVLTESDVAEGPLPPVSRQLPAGGSAQPPSSPRPSSHPRRTMCVFLSSLPAFLASLLLV